MSATAAVLSPAVNGADRYILDANVLMGASRQWYRFSFCSGFWRLLLHRHSAGVLTSIDHVRREIAPGDELHKWVRDTAPKAFFQSSKNSAVGKAYAEIMAWAAGSGRYNSTALADLASKADGWIVAFAMVHGLTVVTHEVDDAGVSRVKIPTICNQFHVPYCNTFAMLQNLSIDLRWP